MHPLFHPLFVDYCAYFNGNKDYFECHEVLEEYWKEVAPGEKLHPLVGYVQLATSMYHWRRDNFIGASRMLEKALINFEANEANEFFHYIDYSALLQNMKHSYEKMNNKTAFSDFLLGISNFELQLLVEKKVASTPPLAEHFILNKHMLRDRSEIIALREKKKRSRD